MTSLWCNRQHFWLMAIRQTPRGWGVGGLPLKIGRGLTKRKIWTHTDIKIVKKTNPLRYQILKHHMRPIEIPDTFPYPHRSSRPTNYGNTGGYLTPTSIHKIGWLCGLNSIAAQTTHQWSVPQWSSNHIILGCVRVHSVCGAPQVAKTGNPTGNIKFLRVWHVN